MKGPALQAQLAPKEPRPSVCQYYLLIKIYNIWRVVFVVFHVSQPYRSVDITFALKIQILVILANWADYHTFLKSSKVCCALLIRAWISTSVSPLVVLIPPSSRPPLCFGWPCLVDDFIHKTVHYCNIEFYDNSGTMSLPFTIRLLDCLLLSFLVDRIVSTIFRISCHFSLSSSMKSYYILELKSTVTNRN